MTVEISTSDIGAAGQSQLNDRLAMLPAWGVPWLDHLREQSFLPLAREGLPTRRVEAWKYTDLRRNLPAIFPTAPRKQVPIDYQDLPFANVEGPRILFVNGRFSPEHSDLSTISSAIDFVPLANVTHESPPWLQRHLGAAIGHHDQTIAALSGSFAEDGVMLYVRADSKIDRPVKLIFMNDSEQGHASYSRSLLCVEEGACLSVIEAHIGRGRYQSTNMIEVIGARGADVQITRYQDVDEFGLQLGLTAIRLAAQARYRGHAVTMGSGMARHQVQIICSGEGADASYREAVILDGDAHADTSVFVDHDVPGTSSRQLFKAALHQRARGVFQGKIIVHPDAQQTDARQSCHALLLSENAEMDAKPELEIYADDVQCAHGATCGQIDQDMVFYLMARGIPRGQAEAIVAQAFIDELLDSIEDPSSREYLQATAHGRLSEWSAK